MSDCIDILRSISATCASINQIGGVDKRAWVTQLNQIESYTFDSNGYVNSLVTKEIGTTNYRYELAQIVGKKNTHSGNYEGVVGENVSLVKQNAILKIYTDSPSDRDKVVELFDAQELVVFFENSNGKIEVFGLDKGLEGSALVGGTGTEMQDDTAVTITLTGDQNKLPYYFLYGGSLATSIEYLDGIGLNPIYQIDSYTAGKSTIDFTPDGSNGWDVGIVANPSTVQLPSGQSIDFVNYNIRHYVGGVETINLNGNLTANDTINTGANGAGVYEVNLSYTLLDGSYFSVNCLFVVDSTNNILHSWSNNGTHVNSVSGLVMDLSADIVDTLNMPLTWKAYNGTLNSVGTGKDAVITLPVGTTDIGIAVTLDAVYSDFPSPEYIGVFSVVIS